MDYKAVVYIDLSKYGQDGQIEIAAPTFRRRNEFSNELSRLIKVEQTRGKDVSARIDEIPAGDWNIMQRMLYVRNAPFSPTVEGFLDYTDRMDAMNPGSADALFDAIVEAVNRIDNGDVSPLEPSQEVTTVTSV